ncbi:MAG: restriction endonuclease [Clostridium lundense]|nr:restriction endonuclease [Clostridium lundense]
MNIIIDTAKFITNFLHNCLSLIILIPFYYILLLVTPIIIDFIALFCTRRQSKLLHKCFSEPLRRFNKNVLEILKKFSVKIYRNIFLLMKFKSFTALFNMESLKNSIMNLEPEEFEQFCAEIYRRLGYKATVTEFGNDGGKDIILTDKYNNLIYVECKRWHELYAKQVGREICQKLIGSCAADGVKKAILITTGKIHENAFEYQKHINKNNSFDLEIVDFYSLIKLYMEAFGVSGINDTMKDTIH